MQDINKTIIYMQDINKRLYTHKSITNRNQNIENKCLKFTFFKKNYTKY